jgi:hypothetical protein
MWTALVATTADADQKLDLYSFAMNNDKRQRIGKERTNYRYYRRKFLTADGAPCTQASQMEANSQQLTAIIAQNRS